MKLPIANAFLLATVVLVSAQAQPDMYDSVCVAYRLSAAQEAQFSASDGQLAAFWEQWDVLNTPSITRDYILMDPLHNAQPGRDYYTGPGDNSLVVRAAYGEQGLYLLIEMIDDNFIDRGATNTDSLHQDVLELYIDSMSSAEIRDGGAAILLGLYSSTLTYSTLQFAISMGATRVYENFRLSRYDEQAWSWQDQWVTFTQAGLLYDGMAFDHATVSPTRKAQEWFLPWSWAGNGGVVANPVPPEGKRLAFAGGCHDMDLAQRDTVCSLKWKNRANPWAAGDNWGDIEIGPALTTQTGTVRRRANTGVVNAISGRSQMYTIRGQLFSPKSRASRSPAASVQTDGRNTRVIISAREHALSLNR